MVVVTHDHEQSLGACLAAVAAQQCAPARVVVADNASSDGSAEVANGFSAKVPLELIRHRANLGFSAAANGALHRCASPWVFLLNPDCAPRPDFVSRLLSAAGRVGTGRKVGAVTGKLVRAEGAALAETPVIDSAGMVVTPAGRHMDRGSGAPDDGSFDDRAWVFGGTGAATLFWRQALEDVAYPDGQVLAESFFAFREDAELAWRLQWRGWSCLYEPAAVAAHRRGLRPERGRRQPAVVNAHSVKNRFLLRAHCADLWWHLACLPWWLLRDLAVIGACLTVERSSVAGLAGAWRARGDALMRRRWVLGSRTEPSRRIRRWFRKKGCVVPVDGP